MMINFSNNAIKIPVSVKFISPAFEKQLLIQVHCRADKTLEYLYKKNGSDLSQTEQNRCLSAIEAIQKLPESRNLIDITLLYLRLHLEDGKWVACFDGSDIQRLVSEIQKDTGITI